MDAASLVQHARANGYAVVQVNTNGATYEITRAIVEAAEEERAPVILGAYETNLRFRGFRYAAMQMRFMAERSSVPVAVHLDHGGSLDACRQAIEAGFTSVMIDGSHLPLDDNLRLIGQVVEVAAPRGISVEAEVGQLQQLNADGSIGEVKNLSDPTEVERVSRSGIDMLAVGIGNAHGFYKDSPDIQFDLLKKLVSVSHVPLVLHGSTGMADDVIARCVALGMAKANLGTLIRTRCVQYTGEVIATGDHRNHPWRVAEAVKDRLKNDIRHILRVVGSSGRSPERQP